MALLLICAFVVGVYLAVRVVILVRQNEIVWKNEINRRELGAPPRSRARL